MSVVLDHGAEWLVAQTWFQHIVGAAQDAVNAGVVTFDLDPSTDTLLY